MASTVAQLLRRVTSGLADEGLFAPLGQPDPAQFVSVVRKSARWAAQWVEVGFEGTPNFGGRASATLPRKAEFVSAVVLVVTLPDIAGPQLAAAAAAAAATGLAPEEALVGPRFGWTNSVGHALIEFVELEIGGVVVERLDGRLLEVLDELYEPLEGLRAKNALIARAPSGFGPTTWGWSGGPLTVHVPLPFWFCTNAPGGGGSYEQALPLDALNADFVRVHVTLRPVEALYYTDARADPRMAGYRSAAQDGAPGSMPPLQGARFLRRAMEADRGLPLSPPYGLLPGVDDFLAERTLAPVTPVAGVAMPSRLQVVDAHLLVEYVSVEMEEAARLRRGDLSYVITQHVALGPLDTGGAREVRLPLPQGGLVKELLWVLQRPEAPALYNAHFLFTRDLVRPFAAGPASHAPWWPDAVLPATAEGGGAVRPAFLDAGSEPLAGATLLYNGLARFAHTGGSLFRSLLPALHYKRTPLLHRYVYAYPFGVGPGLGAAQQGGSVHAEAVRAAGPPYAPRGCANWDLLPRKELVVRCNPAATGDCPPPLTLHAWATTYNVLRVYGGRGALLFA